ncbi:MAG: UBA domain-containing protein [Armatimonadota bacterium]
MNDQLDKIDIIRSRFKVTYEEASNALSAADGDLITALAVVERSKQQDGDLIALGAEVVDEMQKIIGRGPIKRLRVKFGNRVLTEKSVAFTAAATLAVALAAVLITRLIIEVDRGEEEDVREVP